MIQAKQGIYARYIKRLRRRLAEKTPEDMCRDAWRFQQHLTEA